jgi:hypothetical protein
LQNEPDAKGSYPQRVGRYSEVLGQGLSLFDFSSSLGAIVLQKQLAIFWTQLFDALFQTTMFIFESS